MSDSSSKRFTVSINYCVACGYRPKLESLQSSLEREFGDRVRVDPIRGIAGSFDVRVKWSTTDTDNADKNINSSAIQLWNKKEKGGFPDDMSVVAAVKEWSETGKIIAVKEQDSSECSIM